MVSSEWSGAKRRLGPPQDAYGRSAVAEGPHLVPEERADPAELLRRYRQAARTIVRDESLGPRRAVAVVELVELARTRFAEDPWMMVSIQRVLWSEAGEYLESGRTPVAPESSWQTDPVTRRLRALRLAGFARCENCRLPLPSLDALAGWEDQDRAAWLEAVRREGAA
jgi:hypothetical protein